MTMITEDELRHTLMAANEIEVLPDVEGLLRGIDKHARVTQFRRRVASSACVALAVVAGATLLGAGHDDDPRIQADGVASRADVREPDPAEHPELLPPEEPKPVVVEEKVEPTPEPKPEPAPEPKPPPAPESKPAHAPEPKPILNAPAPKPAPEPTPTPTTIKESKPADTTAPMLHVTSPQSGTRVSQPEVAFTGQTEPGAALYTVDRQVPVDLNGNWSVALTMKPGKNAVWFKAKDAAGNRTVAEVIVYYDAPAEAYSFSANQKFGTCSETPPYDIFYGTAAPGTVVAITSEYGSGDVAADDGGKWYRKVYFETAPLGQTFDVTVRAGDQTKTFSFTYTG